MHTEITLTSQCNYSVFDMFNIQVFILRKAYTCSFMVLRLCIHISSVVNGGMCLVHPAIDRTAYMDA
jgi:hypothetical protein